MRGAFPATGREGVRRWLSWATATHADTVKGWERCRRLTEGFDGGRLIVFDIKDGVKLRDLKQVVDLFGQVQQFELAALVAHGGEGTDQLTDARAIDVIYLAQIQQDFFLSLAEQVLDDIAQNHAAFAQGDAP